MDWDKAIESNCSALTDIVAALLALLMAARIGAALAVPRALWRMLLIVLRPAEAAVRRLVYVAARHLKPMPAARRGALFAPISASALPPAPAFALFDPLKTFTFNEDEGGADSGSAEEGIVFSAPDETPVNAEALHQRLRALRHALADLAGQARRLARYNGRRDAALKAGRPARLSPLRPGLPPGWRTRIRHDIDPVLRECHRLALDLANDTT